MFGGGSGGFDLGQLQRMMQQFGIEMTDIEATSVRIETADGEVLVFDDPEVTRMDAQGQETYQIIGEPTAEAADNAETAGEADGAAIPDEDVELVAMRTGASPSDARSALEETEGDLAAAIARLE